MSDVSREVLGILAPKHQEFLGLTRNKLLFDCALQVEEGTSVVRVEDPSLRASSPTLTMLSHFTGLVKLSLDLLRRQQQQKVAELSASTGQ